MCAIVIKSDTQNTKILKELAKKLGANVLKKNLTKNLSYI